MRISDATPLKGLIHPISIGHRAKKRPDGTMRVSKLWFAKWTEKGKERSVSLRTGNKPIAIQRARELDEQLGRGLGLPPKNLSVDDLVTGYLTTKRGENRAPKTIEKYQSTLDEFLARLPPEVRSTAARLHSDHFDAHSVYLLSPERKPRPLGISTWSDRMTIIKQMGKWAEAKGKLARNPFKGCRVPDPPAPVLPCFELMQVARLFATAEEPLRSMVTVLIYSGVRFGELRDLRWDRLDFSRKTIRIDKGGSSDAPKDKDTRIIPMHSEIESVLRGVPRRGERVFYQQPSDEYPDGDNPLDERRLLRSFKRLCERAGLDDPDQYTLHSCRRTFASMLARSNTSYKYALAFMGHSESKMLDYYYRMYDADAAKAIDLIQFPALPAPTDPNPKAA